MFTKYIVVYGCDNSGKTTACENITKILEQLNIKSKVIHSCGPCHPSEQLFFMHSNTHPLSHDEDVVVFDRFPAIEEYVYGPIIRGENKLAPFWRQCQIYIDRISLFIHCDPSLDVITNWGEREQMDGVKEKAKLIVDRYNQVPNEYLGMLIRTKKYDWTKEGNEGLEKIIKGWLRDEHYPF